MDNPEKPPTQDTQDEDEHKQLKVKTNRTSFFYAEIVEDITTPNSQNT